MNYYRVYRGCQPPAHNLCFSSFIEYRKKIRIITTVISSAFTMLVMLLTKPNVGTQWMFTEWNSRVGPKRIMCHWKNTSPKGKQQTARVQWAQAENSIIELNTMSCFDMSWKQDLTMHFNYLKSITRSKCISFTVFDLWNMCDKTMWTVFAQKRKLAW